MKGMTSVATEAVEKQDWDAVAKLVGCKNGRRHIMREMGVGQELFL